MEIENAIFQDMEILENGSFYLSMEKFLIFILENSEVS